MQGSGFERCFVRNDDTEVVLLRSSALKEMGVVNFTHAIKLVANVPDHATVTMTGENLSLLPQKLVRSGRGIDG